MGVGGREKEERRGNKREKEIKIYKDKRATESERVRETCILVRIFIRVKFKGQFVICFLYLAIGGGTFETKMCVRAFSVFHYFKSANKINLSQMSVKKI